VPGDVPAASQSIATRIGVKRRRIRAPADRRDAASTGEQVKQLFL